MVPRHGLSEDLLAEQSPSRDHWPVYPDPHLFPQPAVTVRSGSQGKSETYPPDSAGFWP